MTSVIYICYSCGKSIKFIPRKREQGYKFQMVKGKMKIFCLKCIEKNGKQPEEGIGVKEEC